MCYEYLKLLVFLLLSLGQFGCRLTAGSEHGNKMGIVEPQINKSINFLASTLEGFEATSGTFNDYTVVVDMGDTTELHDILVHVSSAGTAEYGVDYEILGLVDDEYLVFLTGSISASFVIRLFDPDEVYNPDRTITLTLSDPSGGRPIGPHNQLEFKILESDPKPPSVRFMEFSTGAREDIPIHKINLTLSAPIQQTSSVNYTFVSGTAVPGVDYYKRDGAVVFAPGQVSADLEIEVIDDAVYEGDKTIVVELSNPMGGISLSNAYPRQQTHRILEDESPPPPPNTVQFVTSTSDGTEDLQDHYVQIKLLRPAEVDNLWVKVAVDGAASIPATLGDDFSLPTDKVIFNKGESTRTIKIQISDDLIPESKEQIPLKLVEVSAGLLITTGTLNKHLHYIIDNEPLKPTVKWISSGATKSSAYENSQSTIMISAGLSKSVTYPVSVNYSVTGKSNCIANVDFILSSGTIVFQPGETAKFINLNIIGDSQIETNEEIEIQLNSAVNGLISSTYSKWTHVILNDD